MSDINYHIIKYEEHYDMSLLNCGDVIIFDCSSAYPCSFHKLFMGIVNNTNINNHVIIRFMLSSDASISEWFCAFNKTLNKTLPICSGSFEFIVNKLTL